MRTNSPKAIFLDLDDTLIDFSSSAVRCWRATCNEFACQIDGISSEMLFSAIDIYRRWYWEDTFRTRTARLDMAAARREIVAGALAGLGIESSSLAGEIANTFITTRDLELCLFPDTISTLITLRDSGIKLGLITNGGAAGQRAKIERFQLAPYFDAILVEGEFGVGKPDERVYLYMLEQLQVEVGETWMVGDNLEYDVAAPQRLGIFGIWHDVKGAGLPEASLDKPDRIIRALSEIL